MYSYLGLPMLTLGYACSTLVLLVSTHCPRPVARHRLDSQIIRLKPTQLGWLNLEMSTLMGPDVFGGPTKIRNPFS